MSDDMGWAQPGFNGGNKELTPNIDALADEGMRLTQYYTHSVCAPTRAAFLTGKYAFRTWSDWRTEDFGKPSYLAKLGLTLAYNDRGEPTRRIHGLDANERTIAEALKDAGYFTALIGKWHAGEWLPEHLPMSQGFMYQYGHYAWGIDYFNKSIVHNAPATFAVYDWHRNQKPVQEFGYSTDLFTKETVKLIANQADRSKLGHPFFLYVAYNAVHGPLNAPERYRHLDARDAMLKALDDGVGAIVEALDIHGLRDNTLLVFTNDNGPVLEEMSHPYRGTKNTTFEGGVRSPAIVRWPGHTNAGSENGGLMFVADWFSTFISAAGGSQDQSSEIDALDMTDMLFAGKDSPRDEIIYDVAGSVRLPTIRKSDYKLMGEALYNIIEDPYETTDIAATHPELVARLKARIEAVGSERPPLGDKPLLMDPPLPYVYGQEENENPPAWLIEHVDAIRATQPQSWAEGETPWPKAPQGANASKMTGGIDEVPASPAFPQSPFEVDRPEWFQRRGIEYFSEGMFKEAIGEFNKAIELSPHLEARHWQRGIAYYYACEFQKGVDQFELHQTVNSQDVENAVWHFICKARIDGIDAARVALIPIELDGRIPMTQVWNLFAGTGTVEDVLEAANRFSPHKRQQLCYAHLYLGLYYEALGKSELAKKHINLAANDYSMNNYMGMVAQVHAKTLIKE